MGYNRIKPYPEGTKYDDLTIRQQRFIDFYLQTGNVTESAKKAGYSKKTAHEIGRENLKRLGNVIKDRTEEIRIASKTTIADTTEILETLTRIIRGEEKDAFGLDTSNQDKLKALELLGKANQMYTDRVKSDNTMEINVNLEDTEE